jgi:hypothetical protein
MKTGKVNAWFLGTLESMAASQGIQALASVHCASRLFEKGENAMRNIPLQFVGEDTLQEITTVHEKQAQVEAVAGPLGLRTSLVADHWPAIERHKWMLSERLGRDVGAKVAALDYFENFDNGAETRPQGWFARAWHGLLTNIDGDGPRSLAAFERAMRGTQSLAR